MRTDETNRRPPRSHAQRMLAALPKDAVDLSLSNIVQEARCSRSTAKRWRKMQKDALTVRVNISTQPSKRIISSGVVADEQRSTNTSSPASAPEPSSEQIGSLIHFAEFMSLVHLALDIIALDGSKALCELDCDIVMALLNVFLHPKRDYRACVLPLAASMSAEECAAKATAVEQHPSTLAYVVHHGFDKAHSCTHLHILSRSYLLDSLYAQVGNFSSQPIRKTPAQVLSYFERNSNLRRSLDNVHFGHVSREAALLTALLHFQTQLGQRRYAVDQDYKPVGDHTAAFDLAQFIYHHGFPVAWDDLINTYSSLAVPRYQHRARLDQVHLASIVPRLRYHDIETAKVRRLRDLNVEFRDPAFFNDLAQLIPADERNGEQWVNDKTHNAVFAGYFGLVEASVARQAASARLQAQRTGAGQALVDYGPALAANGLATDSLFQNNVLGAAFMRYVYGAHPGTEPGRQRGLPDNVMTPADVIKTRLAQFSNNTLPPVPEYE